ncbi:5-formyltetrahydrofolate cyclo-ligase [Thalassotalea psychrophila]|uniref:5-formyltetrahydrofolate cyclo-ligase n=1 Tax=Thalassotalea psychrophila TaxID=3065647 RepID=A0ABY9U0V9_9GAMM|nr:5-formyltetrahydrofolate cyclo-ligase [Colwelliaceae bacterium SQ149]
MTSNQPIAHSSSTPNKSRAQIRADIRRLRQQLTKLEQQQASAAISAKLSLHPQVVAADSIAVYLANDGELDLVDFIQWCWQQNKQVYLPVIHPFCKGNLLFLHYLPSTPLVNNKYGISEPKLNVGNVLPVAQLDVLITPLVAFDSTGNRIGMGGGFYDRTLATWHKLFIQQPKQSNKQHSKQIKPFPLGVAHTCQKIAEVPVEHWDIPLAEILSPE